MNGSNFLILRKTDLLVIAAAAGEAAGAVVGWDCGILGSSHGRISNSSFFVCLVRQWLQRKKKQIIMLRMDIAFHAEDHVLCWQ